MNFRAQGTIEYLVLIGVILVIALIVGGLLTAMPPVTGTVQKANSLSNLSNPIVILESASDLQGNTIIALQNTNAERLLLQKVIIDGVENRYNTQLSQGTTLNISVQDLNGSCKCIDSEQKVCSGTIQATTTNGLTKSFSFSFPINCSTGVIDTNKEVIVPPVFHCTGAPLNTACSQFDPNSIDCSFHQCSQISGGVNCSGGTVAYDCAQWVLSGQCEPANDPTLLCRWNYDQGVCESRTCESFNEQYCPSEYCEINAWSPECYGGPLTCEMQVSQDACITLEGCSWQ